jgi:hypothetical protein
MVPWSVDPEGDYLSYFTWGNPSASDLEAIFSGPISGPNDFITSAPGVGPNDIWFNELVSVDTSTTPPRMACYITGVAFGNPPNTHGGADYVVPFNGLPLWVGADSFDDNYTGDMADLWIAPGVSLLDGGGAIPLATRNHFIDAFGKPVNPSVYTGLYGGAVLLSGNAAGFATNQLASSSPSD